MKARIRISKIQPIYLQCEDVYHKANLKLHRQKKKYLAPPKMMPKLRGENTEGPGEGSG